MENAKFWLLSRTVIGLIVLVGNRFLKLHIDDQLVHDALSYGIDAIGGALVLIGRFKATQPLKLLP